MVFLLEKYPRCASITHNMISELLIKLPTEKHFKLHLKKKGEFT